MLRGSYAGGSLAVTARCPYRRSGPAAHPACPRPGSRPARSPRGTLPDLVSTATRRLALPSYAPAIHGFATPLRISAALCRRMAKAEQSKALAFHRGASCRHAIAAHRLGLLSPSVASLRCAFPSRRALCDASTLPRAVARGFAVPFSSVAALLNAKLFHRRPEQINALPLQRPSPQLHRRATRCCASPSRCRARQILRHSSLRDAAIAIPLLRLSSRLRCMAAPGRAKPSRHGASLGSSVAVRRNAPPSRR